MKTEVKEFYTIAEVAEMLHVTPATVRKNIHDHNWFPNRVQPGRKILIPYSDLMKLFEQRYGRTS